MKSIKPGRGPSALSAAGSGGAVIFGVFWTIFAFIITKDAPFPFISVIFPLFGVIFIGFGIINAIYHFKNATGKNRMSLLDITNETEEPDPLNQYFGKNRNKTPEKGVRKFEGDYCPYCGNQVQKDFDFCPKCGKDI